MSTFTQIIYQIIFGTYEHKPTMALENKHELYKDIWGILVHKNCHPYQINGIENHLHILTHIHPSIALADLVKDIKLGSSSFIKEKGIFPLFNGWQTGYSAFTYSIDSKENLNYYVKNQEEHHRKKTYREELIELLIEHKIDFAERYLL